MVVLSHGVERTMLCDRGANTAAHRTVDIEAGLHGAGDARHLHLSGYALFDDGSRDAGRYALVAAAGRGLRTSVDAASAGPLRRVGAADFLTWVGGADLLLANLDEARVLVGREEPPAALALALTEHFPHVVVKLAERGAVWASRGGAVLAEPAQPADVLDPTGAGDAFAAGLLDSWLADGGPLSDRT